MRAGFAVLQVISESMKRSSNFMQGLKAKGDAEIVLAAFQVDGTGRIFEAQGGGVDAGAAEKTELLRQIDVQTRTCVQPGAKIGLGFRFEIVWGRIFGLGFSIGPDEQGAGARIQAEMFAGLDTDISTDKTVDHDRVDIHRNDDRTAAAS